MHLCHAITEKMKFFHEKVKLENEMGKKEKEKGVESKRKGKRQNKNVLVPWSLFMFTIFQFLSFTKYFYSVL